MNRLSSSRDLKAHSFKPVQDNETGFTLVEIAIVMVIISVLLSGGVIGFQSFRDNARYSSAELYLDEAQTALLGFALVQGYLPCPDSDKDGVQDVEASGDSKTCTANQGNLPWVDLGLESLTPWDVNAFYAVNQDVTTSNCDIDAGQSVCFFEDEKVPAFDLQTPPRVSATGSGNLNVRDSAGNLIAANVVAVIGVTGRNALGTTAATCAGLHAHETENCDNDADFVMDGVRTDPDNFFDDQLVWLHANILKGQMRDAGLL